MKSACRSIFAPPAATRNISFGFHRKRFNSSVGILGRPRVHARASHRGEYTYRDRALRQFARPLNMMDQFARVSLVARD